MEQSTVLGLFYLMFGVLLVLVLALFALYTLYLVYIHHKYSHIPGPPRDSFFFGHFPSFRRASQRNKTLYHLLEEWKDIYGPVFVIWGLHTPVVTAYSPELTKKVLLTLDLPKSKRTYGKIAYVYNQRTAGSGILTETDQIAWQRKRTMLNAAFHRRYLMNLMPVFNEICDRFLEKIGSYADANQQVNMADEFSRVTLDILGKVAFGVDLHAIDDAHTAFPLANYNTLKGIQDFMRSPFWRINVFSYSYQRKVIKAIQFLRDFGEKVILDRIAAIEHGEETPPDVLNHIVTMVTQDNSLTMEELVDNFLTFFIAGQETTSNQLAFTVFELGKHPDIQERIVKEIDQVLWTTHPSQSYCDFEDLGKLEFLGQTLKESLRLHPPIAILSRWSPDQVDLGGYTIPADSYFSVSPFVVHHDEETWLNSKEFIPDRFAESADSNITGPMYYPFSLGPRTCIGKTLAQFEAKVLMSRLYRQFDVQLVSGQNLVYEETLTIRPKDGVFCTVKRR